MELTQTRSFTRDQQNAEYMQKGGKLGRGTCCLALQSPPGNKAQAGSGYRLSAVGSPRPVAAVSGWISCTLRVLWRLRCPHT